MAHERLNDSQCVGAEMKMRMKRFVGIAVSLAAICLYAANPAAKPHPRLFTDVAVWRRV